MIRKNRGEPNCSFKGLLGHGRRDVGHHKVRLEFGESRVKNRPLLLVVEVLVARLAGDGGDQDDGEGKRPREGRPHDGGISRSWGFLTGAHGHTD